MGCFCKKRFSLFPTETGAQRQLERRGRLGGREARAAGNRTGKKQNKNGTVTLLLTEAFLLASVCMLTVRCCAPQAAKVSVHMIILVG